MKFNINDLCEGARSDVISYIINKTYNYELYSKYGDKIGFSFNYPIKDVLKMVLYHGVELK